METRRYRLSTAGKAEQLVRLVDGLNALGIDDGFRVRRPLGYAYARVVIIEHPSGRPPDRFVRTFDPFALVESGSG